MAPVSGTYTNRFGSVRMIIANRQFSNVGNLGDIIKHAALVQMSLTAREYCSSITYVETHAFVMCAPLTDLIRWRKETALLLRQFSGYEPYVKMQNRYLEFGVYRTSVGIAIDMMNPGRIYLAESDPGTQIRLRQQLDGYMNITRVVDAAEHLPGAMSCAGEQADCLVILIDPFADPDEHWTTLKDITIAAQVDGGTTILLAFSYSASDVVWPACPFDSSQPIAAHSRTPYHLAVYATSDIQGQALMALRLLGW